MSLQKNNREQKLDRIKLSRERLFIQVNDGGALWDLGEAYVEKGDYRSATMYFFQAVAVEQKNPRFHFSLGSALLRTGRFMEAVYAFRQALALDGNHAEAYDGLGIALKRLGDLDLATACLKVATKMASEVDRFWLNLADVLKDKREYTQAYKAAWKAHQLKRSETSFYLLAEAKFGNREVSAGVNWMVKSTQNYPKSAQATYLLGRCLSSVNRFKEASDCYKRALSDMPHDANAHFGLAACHLAVGDFAEGLKEYEWRYKLEVFVKSVAGNFIQELFEPMWSGEDLKGKILLIYGEQGFGDTFQSLRFVSEVAAKYGCQIFLMVYKELVPLLQSLPSVSKIIAYGDLIPRYDYHIAAFGLPLRLGTSLETIPCQVPYIPIPTRSKVPPILSRTKKFRVGIFWSGSSMGSLDYRAIRLTTLARIFKCHSVDFFSFQIDNAAVQLEEYKQNQNVHDLKPFIKSWTDTAYYISQMDLMITIDSGIAHLAGALGAPIWVMLSRNAEWRWLPGGKSRRWADKSPWYPTMRLFRSRSFHSWDAVVGRIEKELMIAAADFHPIPNGHIRSM